MFCYIVIVWHIMTRGWDYASDLFLNPLRNEVNIIEKKVAKQSSFTRAVKDKGKLIKYNICKSNYHGICHWFNDVIVDK